MPGNSTFALITTVTAIATLSTAAPAHHGWTGYDPSKTMTVTAQLRDVTWANPHGGARITWQKKEWVVVLAPPARMEARGLTQAMLAADAPVTLVGQPRLDGTPEMKIERVTIGGKTIELR
jgi:hypothetical protein